MGLASAISAGVGLVGSVIQGVGENNAHQAQAKAAQAQEAQARADRQAAQAAAAPTAQELGAIDKQLATSETTIARQEKLISAIDPTIVEASNQALKLLKGEDASSLNPIRNERAHQRAQLESKLRNQLGAGFATSSAGSEALNRFDEQTGNALSGAQQNSLNTLLSVTAGSRSGAESAITSASGLRAGTIGQIGNIAQRQTNAITGTPLSSFAGSQYAGDIANGMGLASIGGGISKLGGTGAGLLSGSGGAATSPAGTSGPAPIGGWAKPGGT